MYAILSRVPPSLEKLRGFFEEHVKKQGLLGIDAAQEAATAQAENPHAGTPPTEAQEDEEGNLVIKFR
jgi:hypothetical protein